MRLLKTEVTGDGHWVPVLEEHEGQDLPPYAILSHTWGEEEVLFSDVVPDCSKAFTKKSYPKIEKAAQRARLDGHHYIWVDTCCINKESSAELQEAINSMYNWYASAEVCYAYLVDLDDESPLLIEKLDARLRDCRWFTRGFCLQELLAPQSVCFFSEGWTNIGTKQSLASTISSITLIDIEYLLDPEAIQFASVAKRMSWASQRQTRRLEDEAYCLMGLFGVNMPMLYGEGKKAFLRLQQEIWKEHEDQSLFLWMDTEMDPASPHGLLADAPAAFRQTGHYRPYDHHQGASDAGAFGKGVRMTFRISLRESGHYFAGMECDSGSQGVLRTVPAIILKSLSWGVNQYVRVNCAQITSLPENEGAASEIFVPQRISQRSFDDALYPRDVLYLRSNPECCPGGPYYLADMLVYENWGTLVGNHARGETISGMKDLTFPVTTGKRAEWVFTPFAPAIRDFQRRNLLVALLFRQRVDKSQFIVVLKTDQRCRLDFDVFDCSAAVSKALEEQFVSPGDVVPRFRTPGSYAHFGGCALKIDHQTILSGNCKFLCVDLELRPDDKPNMVSHPNDRPKAPMPAESTTADGTAVPELQVSYFQPEVDSHSQNDAKVVLLLTVSPNATSIAFVGRGHVFSQPLPDGKRRSVSASIVLSLAFWRDSVLTFICSGRNRHMWNTDLPTHSTRLLGQDDHDLHFNFAKFSSDGSKILTQEYGPTPQPSGPERFGRVTLWDSSSGEVLRTFGRTFGHIEAAVFAPDDEQIGLSTSNRIYRIIDTATGARCHELEFPWANPYGLAFSPGGSHIATSGKKEIVLWDRITGKAVQVIDLPFYVEELVFSPDGSFLAARPSESTPYLIPVPKFILAGLRAKVNALSSGHLAFSFSGDVFAARGRDATGVDLYRAPYHERKVKHRFGNLGFSK